MPSNRTPINDQTIRVGVALLGATLHLMKNLQPVLLGRYPEPILLREMIGAEHRIGLQLATMADCHIVPPLPQADRARSNVIPLPVIPKGGNA